MKEAGKLRWHELRESVRARLQGKLSGLYGARCDGEAFDNLEAEKQQALLLLSRRLCELELWETVRRVENVYGVGGVGMNFRAWPELESKLRRRKDFTRFFARHSDNSGGFIERKHARASLHFLYREGKERLWAVHFDLYNPWSSPSSAWRHLLYEKVRGVTPDWRMIRAVLTGSDIGDFKDHV